MKNAVVICCWIGLLLSVSCAVNPTLPVEQPAPEKREKKEQGRPEASYRIGRGDILEISTWKEPDFTREVPVRIDGMITFPLLDDLEAAGRSPVELKREIEKRLENYIQTPVVTVGVKQPESKKFYVLGEVQKTGEYILSKQYTVLQAFALAGGFTEWAAKDEIILIRREPGGERLIRVDYKEILKGENLEQNVSIQADDTIIVP